MSAIEIQNGWKLHAALCSSLSKNKGAENDKLIFKPPFTVMTRLV